MLKGFSGRKKPSPTTADFFSSLGVPGEMPFPRDSFAPMFSCASAVDTLHKTPKEPPSAWKRKGFCELLGQPGTCQRIKFQQEASNDSLLTFFPPQERVDFSKVAGRTQVRRTASF